MEVTFAACLKCNKQIIASQEYVFCPFCGSRLIIQSVKVQPDSDSEADKNSDWQWDVILEYEDGDDPEDEMTEEDWADFRAAAW